jgi:hypothetical protein
LGQERGKSGLHRAGYSVTRSEGDLKESATENTQPFEKRVKRLETVEKEAVEE